MADAQSRTKRVTLADDNVPDLFQPVELPPSLVHDGLLGSATPVGAALPSAAFPPDSRGQTSPGFDQAPKVPQWAKRFLDTENAKSTVGASEARGSGRSMLGFSAPQVDPLQMPAESVSTTAGNFPKSFFGQGHGPLAADRTPALVAGSFTFREEFGLQNLPGTAMAGSLPGAAPEKQFMQPTAHQVSGTGELSFGSQRPPFGLTSLDEGDSADVESTEQPASLPVPASSNLIGRRFAPLGNTFLNVQAAHQDNTAASGLNVQSDFDSNRHTFSHFGQRLSYNKVKSKASSEAAMDPSVLEDTLPEATDQAAAQAGASAAEPHSIPLESLSSTKGAAEMDLHPTFDFEGQQPVPRLSYRISQGERRTADRERLTADRFTTERTTHDLFEENLPVRGTFDPFNAADAEQRGSRMSRRTYEMDAVMESEVTGGEVLDGAGIFEDWTIMPFKIG
jgi:hypothetical protein